MRRFLKENDNKIDEFKKLIIDFIEKERNFRESYLISEYNSHLNESNYKYSSKELVNDNWEKIMEDPDLIKIQKSFEKLQNHGLYSSNRIPSFLEKKLNFMDNYGSADNIDMDVFRHEDNYEDNRFFESYVTAKYKKGFIILTESDEIIDDYDNSKSLDLKNDIEDFYYEMTGKDYDDDMEEADIYLNNLLSDLSEDAPEFRVIDEGEIVYYISLWEPNWYFDIDLFKIKVLPDIKQDINTFFEFLKVLKNKKGITSSVLFSLFEETNVTEIEDITNIINSLLTVSFSETDVYYLLFKNNFIPMDKISDFISFSDLSESQILNFAKLSIKLYVKGLTKKQYKTETGIKDISTDDYNTWKLLKIEEFKSKLIEIANDDRFLFLTDYLGLTPDDIFKNNSKYAMFLNTYRIKTKYGLTLERDPDSNTYYLFKLD